MGGIADSMMSDKVLRAASMFGLTVGARGADGASVGTEYEEAPWHAPRTAARLHARLWAWPVDRGMVVLITGPSGGGKSMVLSGLAGLLGPRAIWVKPRLATEPASRGTARASRGTRVVDLFDRPLESTLRLLGRAGLADARLFCRRAGELSEGERFRLSLAVAMDRAERMHEADPAHPPTLLVDEFAAWLDRPAAWGVGAMVRRWAGESGGVRVVAATAHEDLAGALRPDVHAHQPLGRAAVLRGGKPRGHDAPAVRIGAGTRRDYEQLSRFHYRAGPPATVVQVLRAEWGAEWGEDRGGEATIARGRDGRATGNGDLCGVLVVSMPTLNGPWRALAWPGWSAGGDRRCAAGCTNRHLRTISRVIVDPRWRGMGIGASLVRSYLAKPLTPCTEAVAAMGMASNFFARAGMREVARPRGARTGRLLAAFERGGIWPHRLADAAQRRAVALAARGTPLEAALRRWANDARGTRSLADGPLEPLLAAAARSATPTRVYVAG